jgi:hypothetical protein
VFVAAVEEKEKEEVVDRQCHGAWGRLEGEEAEGGERTIYSI